MGSKGLRKIQIGKEVTSGTAVSATSLWRGEGTIKNLAEVVIVPEDVGYLGGTNRSYLAKLGAELGMVSTPATYEQIGYILNAGIKGVAGVQDGAGTDYIYTRPVNTTSKNTIYTYTLEGGDDQQAEEMEYSFVKDFTISGSGGEVLMISANWMGRQVTKTSFTGAISLPTVEEILFGKMKVYIDAGSGTIGTTQVSNSVLGMSLNVMTGIIPKFTADGQLYFSFTQNVDPEIELSITFEHDSNAVAEKDAWLAETSRQIRLKVEGSTVGTPGTTYSVKTLIIDLAGKWTSFDMISDQDGNDIVTGTFKAGYDVDADLFAEFVVVNELSALP